ncbi:hypothetical protein GCK32_021771 [Trichostrongylus colubriformis]|uniref:Uncharacterized protein n=1 Tax=Trichostrongylus colubriformis TaxID=6319 RepID=A0AAN8EZQ8_TRICO
MWNYRIAVQNRRMTKSDFCYVVIHNNM